MVTGGAAGAAGARYQFRPEVSAPGRERYCPASVGAATLPVSARFSRTSPLTPVELIRTAAESSLTPGSVDSVAAPLFPEVRAAASASAPQGVYHYHVTSAAPYISGCYRGTPGTLG